MNLLEKYGVVPTDASVLLHNGNNEVGTEEFFARSAEILEPAGEIVTSEVIPNLEQHYGRWHPTGFMVYPLGEHPELGSLRLHVWPDGLRKRDINWDKRKIGDIYDGDIHNHGWNISSLAIAGFYSDNFYEIETLPGRNVVDHEVASKGLFRVFEVSYAGDNPEALTTDGTTVRAHLDEQRIVHAGELHEIEAGPFHAPTVPNDELGATLVFSSHRIIPTGPQVLIAGSLGPIVGNRQDISEEEKILAKKQIKS